MKKLILTILIFTALISVTACNSDGNKIEPTNPEDVLSTEQLSLLNHYQAIIDDTSLASGAPSASFFAINAGTSGYIEEETSLEFIKFLDMSEVTEMSNMFRDLSNVTSLDISFWDTSNVTTFNRMFSGCSSLTSLDLSSWNISNAAMINYMFENCSSLTSLNISSWDTSHIDGMVGTFEGCNESIIPSWYKG